MYSVLQAAARDGDLVYTNIGACVAFSIVLKFNDDYRNLKARYYSASQCTWIFC